MKKRILLSVLGLSCVFGVQAQNGKATWGKSAYDGKPWVENVSRPNTVSDGLNGRHLSVWSSHGRYYDTAKQTWKWQRPNLFCTTEDTYTQTIVIPYLYPMLENAGAVVISPRERDWQKNEVIVDNDNGSNYYSETNDKKSWEKASTTGFAFHNGNYRDGENPFQAGTARQVKARKRSSRLSTVSYQPYIKEAGRYAVYVSYQTLKNSVDDAEYIVYHKGQETHFKVNQQMGGGTWVYLGTFDFDKGCNAFNRVVLTNHSRRKGVVTADAVRFGGGMGNIVRGGKVSGLPRTLEGARYYTQWAGAPRDVASKSGGANDYNDDINSRSLYTNWLAGGSSYVPNAVGKKVPIEMALAIHSDAGYKEDGTTVGTLAICTTQNGNPTLGAGMSRSVSKSFAEQLVSNARRDIEGTFRRSWNIRSVKDANYSETRLPEVPSAIIETLSHQNFNDMRLGQDPNFKFTLARSIYKTILKETSRLHNTSYVVQPLAPNNFRIEFTSRNKVRLRWNAVGDPLEPTAKPTSFNIYTSTGTSGFDNGVNVRGSSYEMELQPGIQYNFRITACNRGGESFPTEVLSAYAQEGARQTILVVNGFHRLSSPAQVNNDAEQGFDLEADPGVSYGPTAGWNGRQSNFDKTQAGKEGPSALGFGGDELVGTFVAGNDFNYVKTHVEAIATARRYNVVSCSSEAVENGYIELSRYSMVDLALGLEKDDGHSLYFYKAFRPKMQEKLRNYLNRKGRLFVSGAYLSSDMRTDSEQTWLKTTLKVANNGSNQNNYNSVVTGMGMNFDVYRTINEQHYGAYSPDVLLPTGNAFSVMKYADNSSAAVAYQGADYKTFVMAIPFECIKDRDTRNKIMRGIVAFLLK
ncbi:fibronectin type III domain-containing protein [Prevotella sp. HUN102]|uniref:golvesin C-terminal-like domain-containing protein n=1 Tax=Prevotella sp. HUN102 TaxID=1392486 RepID=UPI00049186D9|nr:fibronectin type III domain-containing protein [Prevotella sp. HUN102]